MFNFPQGFEQCLHRTGGIGFSQGACDFGLHAPKFLLMQRLPERLDRIGASLSPERGRGLAILRATTRRLELNRTSRGTLVAFAI